MMINKKYIVGLAATLPIILATGGASYAAAENCSIQLNGAKMNALAYEEYGNYYLPLRAVSEALGYKVEWSGKDNTKRIDDTGLKQRFYDPGWPSVLY